MINQIIEIEEFDYSKFDTEKVSFEMEFPECEVFNVSEGTNNHWNDDELSHSPLWRGKYPVAEYRKILWQQIRLHLPRYKEKGLKGFYNPLVDNSSQFRSLMRLVEVYKSRGRLKLIYISDRQHAELISRCVQYLASVS